MPVADVPIHEGRGTSTGISKVDENRARGEHYLTVPVPVPSNLSAPASTWAVDLVAPSAEVNWEQGEEMRHGQPPGHVDDALPWEEGRISARQALDGSSAGWGYAPKAVNSTPRRRSWRAGIRELEILYAVDHSAVIQNHSFARARCVALTIALLFLLF